MKRRMGVLLFLVLCGWSCVCGAVELDRSKYIGLDEIRRGMKGYCLTSYEGTKIEKFAVDVISVVRGFEPGRDAILVQGTDERFIHTGPVAGCSGSPVYIDGRMAGALAFGWSYSKDALYGVTPIGEMLRVGEDRDDVAADSGPAFNYDFSKPIDLAQLDSLVASGQIWKKAKGGAMSELICPLVPSGLPASVCEQLDSSVGPLGFMAVSGIGSAGGDGESAELGPGGGLVVTLVSGDITMAAVGTVTEVVGDKVYAFGHSFLGYGPIDFPMATGKVHTVVSRQVRSFKLVTPLETVGALRADGSAAVVGEIGAKARTIDLTIRVDRYNDTEVREYKCRLVHDRAMTPSMLRSSVAGAVLMLGSLPPDHTMRYKVAIKGQDAEPIVFENISSKTGIGDLLAESVGTVTALMNNPYQRINIETIDIDIRVEAKNTISQIWSVELSDTKLKAGQSLEVGVVLESVRAGKKRYSFGLKIPERLKAGQYELIICGGSGYEKFLRRVAGYKFVARNIGELVAAYDNLLAIRRDKLYCILVLPGGGIALEGAELDDLPATRVLVFQDASRMLTSQSYPHWIERSVVTGSLVGELKTMKITVEQ